MEAFTHYSGTTLTKALMLLRKPHRYLIFLGLMTFACLFAYILSQKLDMREHIRTGTGEENAVLREIVDMMRRYSPNSTDVGLIMGKTRQEDVKWVQDYIKERNNYSPFIYSTDENPETDLLIPRSPRGREVTAYLSYVVDYYDLLPAYSVFIHANEDQWHNDLFGPKTSSALQNLRFEAVDALGYVNLRCQHYPGCPTKVNPHNPTEIDIENEDPRAYFVQIYEDLFAVERHEVPEHLGGICCAQFAVSRDRIQQRPKSDYERMLRWVNAASTEVTNSFGVGWVFESLWHVVFGMDEIHHDTAVPATCNIDAITTDGVGRWLLEKC